MKERQFMARNPGIAVAELEEGVIVSRSANLADASNDWGAITWGAIIGGDDWSCGEAFEAAANFFDLHGSFGGFIGAAAGGLGGYHRDGA
jgi:hypothetical protein